MDLMDTMYKRRSVRRYTGEDIPEEKLDMIIRAGLAAPTSRDLKPCKFYVVTNRDVLRELAGSKAVGGAFLKDAAAAIAVFADEEHADTWIEDSSIALSYMNLMAAEKGIGSCWVQIHMRKGADGSDAEANCRRILSVPDNYRIVGILSLGIPAGEVKPHDPSESDLSKVHFVR